MIFLCTQKHDAGHLGSFGPGHTGEGGLATLPLPLAITFANVRKYSISSSGDFAHDGGGADAVGSCRQNGFGSGATRKVTPTNGTNVGDEEG